MANTSLTIVVQGSSLPNATIGHRSQREQQILSFPGKSRVHRSGN